MNDDDECINCGHWRHQHDPDAGRCRVRIVLWHAWEWCRCADPLYDDEEAA